MILNFVVSFMIAVLLMAEVTLPIILILALGFIIWRLVRKRWINRIFSDFIYKRVALVREFYLDVGRSAEEKGNKVAKPLAYLALILCIACILKTLWPHIFYHSHNENPTPTDGLPLMFLYIGLIFLGFGVSTSVTSSLFFIRESRKFRVYNRSLEIYLLSKYLENILCITLGIASIIGVAYLWFFFLEKLIPVFRYFKNESASFVELKVNYEETLRILGNSLIETVPKKK